MTTATIERPTSEEGARILADMTSTELLDRLDAIVERHGADTRYVDRLYPDMDDPRREGYVVGDNCRYVHPETGEGCCVVGVFLEELGLLDQAVEGRDPTVGLRTILAGGETGAITQTQLLNAWLLRKAQIAQDQGDTWGYAAKRARTAHQDYLERQGQA